MKHRGWKNYLTNNSLLPAWSKNTQVSGCPGLMNYVTEGIVILADEDYEFETRDGDIIPWSCSTESYISQHYYEQAEISKPNHTIVKFNTGVMARQDETERLVCFISDYEPLDSAIRVMPGMLPLLDIWTPFLINTVFTNGHHKVNKGDPIARVFINFAGNFDVIDDGIIEPKLMMPWKRLADSPNVLTTFNKEMKKCPFHNTGSIE